MSQSPGTDSHFCPERRRPPTASPGVSGKSLMPARPEKPVWVFILRGEDTAALHPAGAVAESRRGDKRGLVSKLPFVPPESLSHPLLSTVLITGTLISEKCYGLKHNKIVTHTSQNMLNLSPAKDQSPFRHFRVMFCSVLFFVFLVEPYCPFDIL